MTGFGDCSINTPCGTLHLELQSVNRKFLEIIVRVPDEISFFDGEIRKQIGERVCRGHVIARVNLETVVAGAIDISELKLLKDKWENIAYELGYEKEAIDLSFLLSLKKSFFKRGEDLSPYFKKVLERAIDQLLESKSREGNALEKVLKKIASKLKDIIKKIDKLTPCAVEEYRKRLSKLKTFELDDERIAKEVALIVDKMDVAEEVERFKAHLAHFSALFKDKAPVGKTMEFVLQEMLREINTIASKSSDINIIKLTIEAKSFIEKLKEQVQNIE